MDHIGRQKWPLNVYVSRLSKVMPKAQPYKVYGAHGVGI